MADFNDCPCWRCREPEGKAARAEMIAEIVDGEYAAHHHVTRELPLVPLDASGQLFPVACCRRRKLRIVARGAS